MIIETILLGIHYSLINMVSDVLAWTFYSLLAEVVVGQVEKTIHQMRCSGGQTGMVWSF